MTAAGATDPAAVVARLRAAGCVFAEEEAALLIGTGATGAELEALITQRASGRPLEHVLGWAEFCGLRLRVTDEVFVPRRRSELLAEAAARCLADAAATRSRRAVGLDLCCGVGALAAVMARRVPQAEVHAVDLDPAAVRCATTNLTDVPSPPQPRIVYRGDLYAPLPERLAGEVDVIVANAPYVPTAEIDFLPSEARAHESALALDGGDDGLSVLRRVISGAPDWLAPGGAVLVECAAHQAAPLLAATRTVRLRAHLITDEDLGATVVLARQPGGPGRPGRQPSPDAGSAAAPARTAAAMRSPTP